MQIEEAGCHCQKLLSLNSHRRNAWGPRGHSLKLLLLVCMYLSYGPLNGNDYCRLCFAGQWGFRYPAPRLLYPFPYPRLRLRAKLCPARSSFF